MIEDLISFETAKLAKEKGFDIPVKMSYGLWLIEEQSPMGSSIYEKLDWNAIDLNSLSCPTQSLLQKWLREKHNINIGLTYFNIPKLGAKNIKYWEYRIHYQGIYGQGKTYEEALETALQKALELIK
jgi:hypothetical protein